MINSQSINKSIFSFLLHLCATMAERSSYRNNSVDVSHSFLRLGLRLMMYKRRNISRTAVWVVAFSLLIDIQIISRSSRRESKSNESVDKALERWENCCWSVDVSIHRGNVAKIFFSLFFFFLPWQTNARPHTSLSLPLPPHTTDDEFWKVIWRTIFFTLDDVVVVVVYFASYFKLTLNQRCCLRCVSFRWINK